MMLSYNGAFRAAHRMNPLDWPLPSHAEGAHSPGASFSHLPKTRGAVDLHTHPNHQLLVPRLGRLRFRLSGGETVVVEPPRALFVWANERHALEAPSGPAELFAVQLAPEALAEASAAQGLAWSRPERGVVVLQQLTTLLRELVHQVVHHGADDSREPPLSGRLAYAHLCLAVTERLARESAPANVDAQAFRSEYVERAVSHLRANLREVASVPELARRVGTSARNLSREFAREVGMPPAKFVAQLRIDEAARLLRVTELPVKEIAWSVGYANVPRFNDAFRARKGCTPTAWRERSSTGAQ